MRLVSIRTAQPSTHLTQSGQIKVRAACSNLREFPGLKYDVENDNPDKVLDFPQAWHAVFSSDDS